MKLFKKALGLSLCGAFLSINLTCFNSNAATLTRSTDNDPVANGYSGAYYNMNYYNGVSGAYNGDLRLSPVIVNDNANYSWCFPTISVPKTSCNVQLSVYLNNANFTDPNAQYIFKVRSSDSSASYGTNIGSINQRYAYGGWNYISSNVNANSGKYNIYASEVMVVSSTGSSKQLGADGLIVTVTY